MSGHIYLFLCVSDFLSLVSVSRSYQKYRKVAYRKTLTDMSSSEKSCRYKPWSHQSKLRPEDCDAHVQIWTFHINLYQSSMLETHAMWRWRCVLLQKTWQSRTVQGGHTNICVIRQQGNNFKCSRGNDTVNLGEPLVAYWALKPDPSKASPNCPQEQLVCTLKSSQRRY